MNEKVTDQARGMFEKATGYVEPPSPSSLPPLLLPALSCLSAG